MNTEKTVRKQAKKVLEGNRSVIISEIMVAVLAFLTGLFVFSLAMSVVFNTLTSFNFITSFHN